MASWYKTGSSGYSPPVMPRERFTHGAVLYGEHLYLFGGYDADLQPVAQVDVLNLATSVWSQAAPYPGVPPEFNNRPEWVATAVLDGTIYLLNREWGFHAYDPALNRYKLMMLPSLLRHNVKPLFGMVAHGGHLYITNGDRLYRFSPAAGWEQCAQPPVTRMNSALVVHGDKLYMLGGQTWSPTSGYGPRTGSVYEYDITGNTWTEKTAAASSLEHPRAAVLDDVIYVLVDLGDPLELRRYDPLSDGWLSTLTAPSYKAWPEIVASGAGVHVLSRYHYEDLGLATDSHQYYGSLPVVYGVAGLEPGSELGVMLSVPYDDNTHAWFTAGNVDYSPPQLPIDRIGGAACVHNGKWFVFGVTDTWDTYQQRLDIFDPTTETWSQGASPPGGHDGRYSALSIGDFIYLFGRNFRHRYDPALDTYAQLANPPFNQFNMAAFAWEGFVYMMADNQLARYDPVSNSWQQLADPPRGWRNNCGFGMALGKLIVYGGNDGSTHFDDAYVYDIASDIWSQAASLAVARRVPTHVDLGHPVAAMGYVPSGDTAAVEWYDVLTNSWYQLTDNPLPRSESIGLKTPGGFHVLGGYDAVAQEYTTTVVFYGVAEAVGVDATLGVGLEVVPAIANLTVGVGVPVAGTFGVTLAVPKHARPTRRLGVAFSTFARASRHLPVQLVVRRAAAAADVRLTERQPGQWDGVITSFDHLRNGPFVLELAEGLVVAGTLANVAVKLEEGIATYTGSFSSSDAARLERLLVTDLPRDPVQALQDAGAHVKLEQFNALREAVPRPTASEYFTVAGEAVGVHVLIDDDVVGAHALMPFSDTWSPVGKTLRQALNEVFGLAKAIVYLDASGRARVRRSARPDSFGPFLSASQVLDFSAHPPTRTRVEPTFYAGSARALKLTGGMNKKQALEVINRKFNVRNPDAAEYLAEWYAAVTLTSVPLGDGQVIVRALGVRLEVARPPTGLMPRLPQGRVWSPLGVRLEVT